MAAAMKPGPLGTDGAVTDLNDGTLVRNLSPLPDSSGRQSSADLQHLQIAHHRHHRPHQGLPILRLGANGEQVRRAQLLLNLHGAANQPLRADGAFGAETQAAVISFQRSRRLRTDGVIGIATWAELVVTGVSSTGTSARGSSVPAFAGASAASAAGAVSDWSLTLRFQKVLEFVPRYLSPELATQFRAMLTPQNIGMAVGTLAVWAVSQAFGVGEIVDVILLVVGAAFVGMAVFKAGEDLGECLLTTLHAQDNADLEKAADALAQAVIILGVTAFFALLAKVAARFARGSGAAEESAAGSSPAAAENSAPPPPPRPTAPTPKSKGAAPPLGKAAPEIDAEARTHILEGDPTKGSGGHRPGTGLPGKSEFPSTWSDDRILSEIWSVASDSASTKLTQGKTSVIEGLRDGVKIRVIIRDGRIVTGYPTSLPRNP